MFVIYQLQKEPGQTFIRLLLSGLIYYEVFQGKAWLQSTMVKQRLFMGDIIEIRYQYS